MISGYLIIDDVVTDLLRKVKVHFTYFRYIKVLGNDDIETLAESKEEQARLDSDSRQTLSTRKGHARQQQDNATVAYY